MLQLYIASCAYISSKRHSLHFPYCQEIPGLASVMQSQLSPTSLNWKPEKKWREYNGLPSIQMRCPKVQRSYPLYTVTVHLDLRQHFDKDQLFGGLTQNSMAGSASEQRGDDKSKGPSLKGAGRERLGNLPHLRIFRDSWGRTQESQEMKHMCFVAVTLQ